MLNAKHKRAHTMTVYITQKQAKLTHCIGKWDNTQPGEEGGQTRRNKGDLQGYWGCDLGTNNMCKVSENSTYKLTNCTLCTMCTFFEDYKSHSFAGDCDVQFNI